MSDETLIARLRPHARALFWPTLVLLAVAAALGFLSGAFREAWQNIAVLCVAGVILLLGWLAPLLRWLATSYTITSRRLVVQGGIVVRSRQELLHSRALDVTVRKRAVQALFGSGDVLVNSGLEQPVVLRDVPSATLVQAALNEVIERPGQTYPSDRVHA